MQISQVPEVPLVISNGAEATTKTKAAVELLKRIGAHEGTCQHIVLYTLFVSFLLPIANTSFCADVEKAKDSKKLRVGKGKMRNRRYTLRRGPLVIYHKDEGIVKAFRNLPGVDLADVTSLNLLQLAPGGHLGRFVIWTQGAFEQLDNLYGTFRKPSALKSGYSLPQPMVFNSDINRIINSDEIQSVTRPKQTRRRKSTIKKNPLKNFGVMVRLNPYAQTVRRAELLNQEARTKAKAELVNKKRNIATPEETKGKKAKKAVGKKFFASL